MKKQEPRVRSGGGSGGDDRPPRGGLSRREFLVGTAAGLAAATAAGQLGCQEDPSASVVEAGNDAPGRDSGGPFGDACAKPSALPAVSGSSRVVEVVDTSSVSGSFIDSTKAKSMLLAGISALAASKDGGAPASTAAAWKILIPDFSATMKIGLKLNCLSSYVYSSPELVTALVESLVNDLGADASKIVVWDRRGDELERSLLTTAAVGAEVLGTVKSTTDSSGPGYETAGVCVIDKELHLSKILTTETDITINLALLKTHGVSGATGALKNVYGCIDNPGDFHSNIASCIPAIYRIDDICKRIRLNITEAFQAVVKGETSSPADRTPGRILVSQDPVAIDACSVAVINALRAPAPALQTSDLGWLDGAASLNLGTKSYELVSLNLGPAFDDGGAGG